MKIKQKTFVLLFMKRPYFLGTLGTLQHKQLKISNENECINTGEFYNPSAFISFY